jgi:hypothetical protein
VGGSRHLDSIAPRGDSQAILPPMAQGCRMTRALAWRSDTGERSIPPRGTTFSGSPLVRKYAVDPSPKWKEEEEEEEGMADTAGAHPVSEASLAVRVSLSREGTCRE